MKLAALLFSAAGMLGAQQPQQPICKTAWPVQVCYTIKQSPIVGTVLIAIKALESQSDYLPITGYFVDGRIKLSNGAEVPVLLIITRDDWDGFNSASVTIPPPLVPSGVSHLTVIARRNAESVLVY